MPETFWMEEYRKKALLPDPVSQTGRGHTFQAVEFLYVVKQAVELLELQREHSLLDIGCANGLLDIVLSSNCKSLLAVDPVEELVTKARENLRGCANAEVRLAHAGSLPVAEEQFDRILLMGVLQLISPKELPGIFTELKRVLRPGGRILFGSIPDKKKESKFLDPYLDGVKKAKHLSEEQKAIILTRNRNAHWYDGDELASYWILRGASAWMEPLNPADPDHDHRFHLVVSFPG